MTKKSVKMKTSPALGILSTSLPAALLLLSSCVGESAVEENAHKYKEWKETNELYVEQQAALTDDNGNPLYTRIDPAWAPSAWSLIRWHNDRSLTAGRLSPLDNSTVEMTYQLLDIAGNEIQNSFDRTDSIYQCRPCDNITGVWTALTNMHVGDTVTVVIPALAGYGGVVKGDILPYSTLVYNIKLKSISAYQVK